MACSETRKFRVSERVFWLNEPQVLDAPKPGFSGNVAAVKGKSHNLKIQKINLKLLYEIFLCQKIEYYTTHHNKIN